MIAILTMSPVYSIEYIVFVLMDAYGWWHNAGILFNVQLC